MTGELAPSIISADQAHLADQLLAVEPFAARWHVDVMDGHYVPNLTIGPSMVSTIGRISKLPQDLHLMICNPDETWDWYARAGAERIAVHPETSADITQLLDKIREEDVVPGLAINPNVSVADVENLLDRVGFLVVMTVHPGFSGQAFIAEVMPKLAELRALVDSRGLDIQLVVDGGVNAETAPVCVESGADVLVSASAIFASDDPPAVARSLASMWDSKESSAHE